MTGVAIAAAISAFTAMLTLNRNVRRETPASPSVATFLACSTTDSWLGFGKPGSGFIVLLHSSSADAPAGVPLPGLLASPACFPQARSASATSKTPPHRLPVAQSSDYPSARANRAFQGLASRRSQWCEKSAAPSMSGNPDSVPPLPPRSCLRRARDNWRSCLRTPARPLLRLPFRHRHTGADSQPSMHLPFSNSRECHARWRPPAHPSTRHLHSARTPASSNRAAHAKSRDAALHHPPAPDTPVTPTVSLVRFVLPRHGIPRSFAQRVFAATKRYPDAAPLAREQVFPAGCCIRLLAGRTTARARTRLLSSPVLVILRLRNFHT